jgi:hypothetical protein
MSSPPSFSSVSSTTRWTGSMVERSAETISALRPRARTLVDVSSAGVRPTAAMSAPAAASARAIAWPIPVLAPVTMAILPVRSKGLVIFLFS